MSSGAAIVEARVARIGRLGAAGTRIDLAVGDEFPAVRAGQFVQIACGGPNTFRLRRPFSVCRFERSDRGWEIGILFSVVGEGSRWLDGRRAGDSVGLIGPLGNPFHPPPGRVPILVAGGRGVAPLMLLAEQIAPEHPEGLLLYGARDTAAIFPTEGCPFPVYRSTLDASVGSGGTVIDLLEAMLSRGAIRAGSAALFGCGPLPMLASLAATAEAHDIPAQVSVETIFGCGTGLCAGCAIPLRTGGPVADAFHRYAFACTDGPVFDGQAIDWPGVRE